MKATRTRQMTHFAISAFALAMAAAASAQTPILDVAGVLRSSSDVGPAAETADGGEHRVRLVAGQRVIVSARSSDFDTVVQVTRAGEPQPLAENDDHGDGLDSRLVFTADQPGDYLIRVASFSPDDGGGYQLRVDPAPPLPAPRTDPSSTLATSWRLFDGRLDSADAQGGNGRFDDVRVSLVAGRQQIVLLDAAEGTFDPIVEIYLEKDGDSEPLGSNDDGGADLGSVLLFTPPETGEYIIRVASFERDGEGAYRLRVGETPARH